MFSCCIAAIYYTGNSQKDTGNWCFSDGIITFQEIFELYKSYFLGKRLSIICDCSYSGNWVHHCANVLDDHKIPPCGHQTTKRGIFIRLYTSCRANQEATMLAYTRKGLCHENGTICWPLKPMELSLGQKTTFGDFRKIRCQRNNSEKCLIDSTFKWSDRVIKNRVRLIIGRKDEAGCPIWQYILIREDKMDQIEVNGHLNWFDLASASDTILTGKGDKPSAGIIAEKTLQYGKITTLHVNY